MVTDAAYRPRNPEESLLYQVVAGELETFLAAQQDHERQVPGFIEKEFRSFLDCGVLARGFLRIACNTCRLDRVVAFSCKSRGICPSCGGRRMADTAAHLVDHVIPDVPVRQWVLSPPPALRYRVAYDSQLLAVLIRIFIRAIFSSLRCRARACGIPRGQCGAVAFVQRLVPASIFTPMSTFSCWMAYSPGWKEKPHASIPYARRMTRTSPPWLKRHRAARRRC